MGVLTNPYLFSTPSGLTALAEMQADTPWGLWNAADASGNLTDSSGNSRTATVTGAPTAYSQNPSGGPNRTGISWPATTTDLAQTSATATVIGTGDYCLEAWFYMPTSAPAVIVNLFQVQVLTTQYVSLRLLTTGVVRNQLQSAGGSFRDSAATSVNTWNHVVCQYRNGVAYTRLNKANTATTAKAVSLNGGVSIIHGGASTGAGAVIIGPTAFYEHAVTDARFDAHYDAAS